MKLQNKAIFFNVLCVAALIGVACIAASCRDKQHDENMIVDEESSSVVDTTLLFPYSPTVVNDSVSVVEGESVETPVATTAVSPNASALHDAYCEGFDQGYEDGLEDRRLRRPHGAGFDDTNDYSGDLEDEYEKGYDEGYDDGFADGDSEGGDDEEDEE